MSDFIVIQGGTVVDPLQGTVSQRDLYIDEGELVEKPEQLPEDATVIQAAGYHVMPGLIDIHVHLREPGGEQSETIETGSKAAACGGFTTVVPMPNTTPPLDTPERVSWQKARGDEVGLVRVAPSACITQDRGGEVLADLEKLAGAGAVCFTDDGATVQDQEVMFQAMQIARELGVTMMDHAQDRNVELQGGVMHEGGWSKKLGLPGIPSKAEYDIVARDVALAGEADCAMHIQHVSARESVDLIQKGQELGARVTGELTPHHLAFTDADVKADAPERWKMNPPLRSAKDQERLIEAVIDGTLCCFATDHAPHAAALKAKGFIDGPFGILGMEVAAGVTHQLLVKKGLMDLLTWAQRWTVGPAAVLGLPPPSLQPGNRADLVLMDLENEWIPDASAFQSRSVNSPFIGQTLSARAVLTICRGNITWQTDNSLTA